MHRGDRHFAGRRARRYLLLITLSLAIAVAVPTVVLAGSTPPVPGGTDHPSWSKAPEWTSALSGGASGQVGGEVIVEFARGSSTQAMTRAASVAGATLKQAHTAASNNGVPFAVYSSSDLTTAQLIASLKKQPGVVSVTENRLMMLAPEVSWPNDPSFGSQWALENTGQVLGRVDADIDALAAWERTQGSEGVVVAVIDSGVFYEHPDLTANMWKNPGEKEQPYDGQDNEGNGYFDDVYGIDVINGDSDPLDDCGHGTHVAGTIAATGNNGVGVAGVSWNTRIMALKAFDCSGYGSIAAVIECINYAIDQKVEHGVNVVAINASFEGDGYNETLRNAIQAAGDAGIVFVAAAGNRTIDVDASPVYPAAYNCDNIIAVGATDSYDSPADFSNYGATGIDLFAPGVGILNTIPPTKTAAPGTSTLFFDDMEYGSGNWTPSAPSVENPWAITTEANWGSTGTHAWSDSPDGPYLASSRYTLTSRTINLGAAVSTVSTGAWLGFAVLHDLGRGDGLIVKVSGNNGETWQSVHLFQGTGEQYYWSKLPEGSVSSTFKVQFVLETGELAVGDYDGVYLDNVCITTSAPALYAEYSGTSMAAPHVTGTVALLAASSPASTVATRIDRVLSSVDTLEALSGLCVTSGRLNTGRALVSDSGPPSIREMEPMSGPASGGNKVHIYGSNFHGLELAGSSGVTFGGVDALSYYVESSEYIKAYAPAGVEGTTVQVQVNAAGGSTPDTEADNYTYMPVPTITEVSPATGPTTGGVKVTITGTNFEEVSNVTFGGVAAKEWWKESSSMLMAIIPAHAAGTVRVKVYAAGGYTADTAADDFTYVATTAVQQNDTRLGYLGPWTDAWSAYASGGSYTIGDSELCRLTVTFEGSYMALVGKTGPDGGKAWVTIDGVEKGYADFYSETARYQQIVYATGMLETGPHTVIFQWAGVHRDWSSGFAINADVIHVLGEVTQAPVPERHQQNEPKLTYTGDWATGWTWWLASDCTYAYVSAPGASVNVTFDGTYLAWVGKTGPDYGKAQVRVDDGELVTVDLYSPYNKYKQKIFETGLLADKEHTLSIYWLGAKSPASSGWNISVDTFDVFGELTESPKAEPITWSYDQSDSRITYVGSWGTRWTSAASAWSFYYSTEPGAGAVVEFEGDSVELIAKKGPPYGKVAISLDGGEPTLVDLYAPEDVFRQSIYSKTGLSDGPHTLTIRCTGEKNENAVMAAINIDGLNIKGVMTQGPVLKRFQQDDPALAYTGDWSTGSTWSASGGSFKSTVQNGAKVTVTFEGSYLSWVARTTPWYGQARVTLDDQEPVVVDLFSWGVGWKAPVYDTGLLEHGVHTLQIECVGARYWRSWGFAVAVDAFDVLGELEAGSL